MLVLFWNMLPCFWCLQDNTCASLCELVCKYSPWPQVLDLEITIDTSCNCLHPISPILRHTYVLLIAYSNEFEIWKNQRETVFLVSSHGFPIDFPFIFSFFFGICFFPPIFFAFVYPFWLSFFKSFFCFLFFSVLRFCFFNFLPFCFFFKFKEI